MGEAIKGITSEGATVVVGTVIDPNMLDELRVTIVATGLGRSEEELAQQAMVETIRTDGSLDYQQLDRPALLRRQSGTAMNYTARSKSTPATEAGQDVNYLDIPAFLRKQESD